MTMGIKIHQDKVVQIIDELGKCDIKYEWWNFEKCCFEGEKMAEIEVSPKYFRTLKILANASH